MNTKSFKHIQLTHSQIRRNNPIDHHKNPPDHQLINYHYICQLVDSSRRPLKMSEMSEFTWGPIKMSFWTSGLNHSYQYHLFLLLFAMQQTKDYPVSLYSDLQRHQETELVARKVVGHKRSTADRFIPHPVSHHLPIMRPQTSSKMDSSTSPQLSNYQSIFQQHVIGHFQDKANQSISDFQNQNLLRFSAKTQKGQHISKPWLSGMELRQQLLTFKNQRRSIKKVPFKVLEAPALQDDFYLNLIDWSPQDFIAVGLSTSAYIWNPKNCQSFKLCDLGIRNSATSVGFCHRFPLLAIGTHSGVVHVWDIQKLKRVRSFGGHSERVGSIAWGSSVLSTGSRDKTILHRDLRCFEPYTTRLISHTQEVCGLKWSHNEQQLCSGGNDNRLIIWSKQSEKPQIVFSDHVAAVKAISWSHSQHSLVASGGGTADRTIKLRNTLTGETTKSWDTGSQVCNLAFSRSLNEVVSTHGYSHNEISIWNCQSTKRLTSLTGHSFRVLYLAMSPDGSTVVTGSGDETIRFWEIFPPSSGFEPSEGVLDDCLSVIR